MNILEEVYGLCELVSNEVLDIEQEHKCGRQAENLGKKRLFGCRPYTQTTFYCRGCGSTVIPSPGPTPSVAIIVDKC